ncbi:MAG: hypothetical protein RIF41_27925 [Polyangiaceae bacterium]
MSWIKLCDRTHQRKRAAHAGITAMGFWGALMTHAAHLESDGKLEAEDIEHAWHYGFGRDAELWGDILGQALDELDDVTAEERALFERLSRRAARQVGRAPEGARDVLVAQLREAKLLKRQRGRAERYELEHPDREPYLAHQLSREQNARMRERNREKQRRRRERLKAEELAMEHGLSLEQALEMLHEEAGSPGDSPGASPGGVLPCPPASSSGERRLKTRDGVDFQTDGKMTSLLNFVTPSRPPRELEAQFEMLPEEVREIHATLLAENTLKPLAEDFSLSVALYRLQKHVRVSTAAMVGAIRETAVEAAVRLATGTIRSFRGWVTETLIQRCKASSDAKASEVEHARLTAHEKRTGNDLRRFAYQRSLERENNAIRARDQHKARLEELEAGNFAPAAGLIDALT